MAVKPHQGMIVLLTHEKCWSCITTLDWNNMLQMAYVLHKPMQTADTVLTQQATYPHWSFLASAKSSLGGIFTWTAESLLSCKAALLTYSKPWLHWALINKSSQCSLHRHLECKLKPTVWILLRTTLFLDIFSSFLVGCLRDDRWEDENSWFHFHRSS